jgi:two-component system CheB/CheR fusion protein
MADVRLETLLEHVKRTRGFDFTGYKRASLERRIQKRMTAVGVADYGAYLDVLEVDPGEFAHLFDTILINVTGFFRDAPAWELLSTTILPRLLESIGPNDPVRVWSAGCSSGQETYTIAMLLAEALGEGPYCDRVKLYATDVDEHALALARAATYSARDVEAVPPVLLDRYFERVDSRFAFRKDLRRTVIFGRNDLVQDAPISRVDLLSCRNTLMYLNAETQGRVLDRFNFALNPWGFLFLGKSEMLITHGELFRPVDLRRRVFQKVPRPTLRERLAFAPPGLEDHSGPATSAIVRDRAFDASPVAQIVIDDQMAVVHINQQARTMFGLTAGDVGRTLKDLELSYRPVELRANLELAMRELRTVSVPAVTATMPSGDKREMDVQIVPLVAGQEWLGATILYHDVSSQRRLEADLETAKREIETAYEELQSTVEELETTNEELQSTNEELETTNEELQSSNEELETTNEELQSTNEELETINEEVEQRSVALDRVNAFLERILTTLEVAVAVIDGDQRIRLWNGQSTELWGLRPEEAEGQHLLSLDLGVPLDDLRAVVQTALAGEDDRAQRVVDATNRRGRPVRLQVTGLPTAVDGGQTGAIILMDVVAEDGRAH